MSELGPHFTADELRCKGSGLYRLHPAFPAALRVLRVAYGRPMVITSGCRNSAHNAAVGGAPRSYHLADVVWPDGSMGTLAVDVRISSDAEAYRLAQQAMIDGWAVGVSTRGFIHLDYRRAVGAVPVLFGYGGK
jgi:hypothetical protein